LNEFHIFLREGPSVAECSRESTEPWIEVRLTRRENAFRDKPWLSECALSKESP
jgi:hypothetical protein